MTTRAKSLSVLVLFVALAVAGCSRGASSNEPAPEKDENEFVYSHTVAGLDTPECVELRSTCEDVALLCEGAEELAPACRDVAGKSTDAYALPGASTAPGRPFGVGSCIELAACSE